MKRITLILAIFLCASTAFAADLPKIAVYVTGDVDENTKDAFGTRMLTSLVNSRQYMAIERSERFLDAVKHEHIKQRSGAIDDKQIRELGRQFGAKYLCVADISSVLDGFQISARIINVETAVVPVIGGVLRKELRTITDLEQVVNEVIKQILPPPPPPPTTTQQLNGIVMFSEFNVENINNANNEDLYPWLLIGFFYDGALIEGLYFYTELQYQLRLTAIENQNGNSVSLMWLSFNIELYYNLNMFYLLLKNEYNIRITPRFDLYGIKNENREGILTPGIGLNLFSELYIQIETPLTYIRFWRNEDDNKFHSNPEIVLGWWRGRYNSSGERITSTFDIKNKALQLNAHYLYSLNRFTFYIGCELNDISTKSDMMIKPFLGVFFRF